MSVLVPIFNAADTLPFALASLQAQTYHEWECVLVDDGSTDNPDRVVKTVGDRRIRYVPLDRNRGRGYARQRALELARGKYVAFLDADDWYYPNKLQLQIGLLESQPDLALVSTGMAISNINCALRGVRNADVSGVGTHLAMTSLRMPSFAFAPSMIAAQLAKETAFDTSFPISEDVDFLVRALLGRSWSYGVIPVPLYAYREQSSTTLSKVSPALNFCCRMFWKHARQYPARSVVEVVKARTKQAIYHGVAAVGLWNYIIPRRSRLPNEQERQHYKEAFGIVSNIADAHANNLANA